MKYLFFLLTLLSLCSCFKTPISPPNPRNTITKTVTFENISANDIFDKTEMYFAKSFDGSLVFELNNREGKMLYGSYSDFIFYNRVLYKFTCSIEIYIKENKLKCSISNIDFGDLVKPKGYKHLYSGYYEYTIPEVQTLVDQEISNLFIDMENNIKKPIW